MNIDEKVMSAAVAKAILDSLGEDGQKLIIEEAVKSLLDPDTSKNYGYNEKRPNRIQKVFLDAAAFQAHKIVKDQLENNEEFQSRVNELVKESISKVFEGDSLSAKLSDVISESIEKLTLSRY